MFRRNFPLTSFFFDEDPFSLFSKTSGLSVYEEGDRVIVEVDLPGLTADDIKVIHSHGYLIIEGEKKEDEKKRKYYKQASRTFSYRVPIPNSVDMSADPEAIFKEGIMRIIFKKGQNEGTSIPIKKEK